MASKMSILFFLSLPASIKQTAVCTTRQRGARLFDKGNEGNDGRGSKTVNCYGSPKEKDGDMMSVQPAARRKHGTRARCPFFELIEGHRAFTPHKLPNHRFNFPERSVWETAASGP
jgi:hypothetical protein